MANPDDLRPLNAGVTHWNQWRSGLAAPADLSGADLSGKDLAGAHMQGANLKNANLRNAHLKGTDFSQADLSGGELQGVDFSGANLVDATLREAELQGADFRATSGALRTEQLAGADLTGAKLPDDLKTLYEKLENVKGISESARKIFLAVLAGCLYCWLTIATTTDVNLITNRASSPLPIIQTPIPIVGFYVVAPLLVLCVYFYFHFYLQKLWEELGSLPAVFPDGRPLHTKVDPWLLNDLVRAHLPKLNVNRPFLSHFQLRISVLLAWWIVPLTLLLFWGRYLRRHEPVGTGFHVLLLVISLVGAVCLYRLAIATLRGLDRKPFRWKGLLTSRRGYQTTAYVVAVVVLFGLTSWGAIWGVRPFEPRIGLKVGAGYATSFEEVYGLSSLVPRLMERFGYTPFANLTGAEISQKKSTWNRTSEHDFDVIEAQLPGVDLRYAWAVNAFFPGANLMAADLRGAFLINSDLQRAYLPFANLNGAYLSGANLSGAKVSGADLRDTDLRDADLRNADLSGAADSGEFSKGANLSGANLIRADLRHVNLAAAELSGANLTDALMTDAALNHAKLNSAELRRVDLKGASLNGADLSGARLIGANLSGADLTGTQLGGTDFSLADLTYADLRRAKSLDSEKVRKAEHWDQAFYDPEILRSLGLSLDHNEKLAEQWDKEKKAQQEKGAGPSSSNLPPSVP